MKAAFNVKAAILGTNEVLATQKVLKTFQIIKALKLYLKKAIDYFSFINNLKFGVIFFPEGRNDFSHLNELI